MPKESEPDCIMQKYVYSTMITRYRKSRRFRKIESLRKKTRRNEKRRTKRRLQGGDSIPIIKPPPTGPKRKNINIGMNYEYLKNKYYKILGSIQNKKYTDEEYKSIVKEIIETYDIHSLVPSSKENAIFSLLNNLITNSNIDPYHQVSLICETLRDYDKNDQEDLNTYAFDWCFEENEKILEKVKTKEDLIKLVQGQFINSVIYRETSDNVKGNDRIPGNDNGDKIIISITIPKYIKNIRENAFKGYSGLKSVVFKKISEVESIKDSAFEGCIHLESITIPKSVKNIGKNAFKGCTSLKSVVFEENSQLKSIENSAFEGCNELIYVDAPEIIKHLIPNVRPTVAKKTV